MDGSSSLSSEEHRRKAGTLLAALERMQYAAEDILASIPESVREAEEGMHEILQDSEKLLVRSQDLLSNALVHNWEREYRLLRVTTRGHFHNWPFFTRLTQPGKEFKGTSHIRHSVKGDQILRTLEITR